MEPAEEFSTLVHEMAHEMLHRSERRTLTTKQVREAEAVAFVVCQSVGLQTGTASADYIQLWNGDAKLRKANLVNGHSVRLKFFQNVSSGSQQVDLQFLVPVLACPQVQRYRRQFIYNGDCQPRLRQIDTFQIFMACVANVHSDVSDLRRGIVRHLRFSLLSARRTIDSSKSPFMSAEHANQ
jgi:hypothetical protein